MKLQPRKEATMNPVPDFDEYWAAKAARKKKSPRPPRTPSQIQDKYWVSANSRKNGVRFTERSGKWLIFVPMAELDDAWSKIKQATQAGLLSNFSKAATGLPNPNAIDPDLKVICVYTYDSDDREDVFRVRQALRDLGSDRPMPYKTDQATRECRYQVHGDRRISLYYE
jgi:Domain of unknown function (DUF1917)